MIARRTLAPAALIAVSLAGCASEDAGAQMVVGLTTDMAVGFDLTRLEATAIVDGVLVQSERLSYGDGDLSLPAEVLAFPAPDGAGVEVSIEAYRAGEALPFVTRRASTRAADGRLLPLSLDEACSGVVCAAGATCLDGACVDPFVDPSSLPDHDPAWIVSDSWNPPPGGSRDRRGGGPGSDAGCGGLGGRSKRRRRDRQQADYHRALKAERSRPRLFRAPARVVFGGRLLSGGGARVRLVAVADPTTVSLPW